MRAFATRLVQCCLLAAALAAGTASAVNFNGANNGPIPDNDPAGRTMTFDVANVKGRVRSLSVSIEITHSFVGDLDIRLVSPSGLARLVLLSRAGGSRTSADGMHANLAGVYSFSDTATGDLWASIKPKGTDDTLAPGNYRTTTAGRLQLSDVGGCSTHLNRAFGGLSGADLNGQWTLQIADRGPQDFGAVNVATLAIEIENTLFAGDFEDLELQPAAPVSTTRGRCKHTQFDFTGSGMSSYVIVHPTGGNSDSPLAWAVRDNVGASDGALTQFEFGQRSDFALDGDYDGDGISDAVVWRESLEAFLVRRSSRPGDVPLVVRMGKSDNSTLAGDYDGDGITDAAVYREGGPGPQPGAVHIALSRAGTRRVLDVGQTDGYASGGVDSSGDGRADVFVQSDAVGLDDVSRYDLYTATGTLSDSFTFGAQSAYAVPGHHLGAGIGSLTLIDDFDGAMTWNTRNLTTDIESTQVVFGLAADFALGGDYDGDGIDDYATWRGSNTPGQSRFLVRRSTQPSAAPLEVPAGEKGDQIVAASRVN